MMYSSMATRRLKLFSQIVEVAGRVRESIIIEKVDTSEMQSGSIAGRDTTYARFVVKHLQENFLGKKKAVVFCVCKPGKVL